MEGSRPREDSLSQQDSDSAEDGVDGTEQSTEEPACPATPSWQLATGSNVTKRTSSKSPDTERLFERCQQMQQMFTHMTTMMQDLNENINHLRAQRCKEDNPALTLTKGSSLSKAVSETATNLTGNSPLTVPLELQTSHQGEYGNIDDVFTSLTEPDTLSKGQTGTSNDSLTSSGPPRHQEVEELVAGEKGQGWAKEILTTLKLAQMPLPTFSDGTCAEYWSFKRAFLNHVKGDEVKDSQKLNYLVAAYSGPAKEELCGCQELEEPKEGYKEAWSILEARHGNKRKYVQYLVKKVCGGPDVRLNDTNGLRCFRNDLSTSVRNLKVMGELRQIDTYETIRVITDRFKGRLRDDYSYESHSYEKLKDGNRCGAEWLLTFIVDVLERTEKFEQGTEGTSGRHGVPSRTVTPAKKATGLATAASEARGISHNQCSLCQDRHHIESCKVFIGMNTKDRLALVRRERRCISCLDRNHWVATCNQKRMCGIDCCQESHSRLLHITGGIPMRHEVRPTGGYTAAPQGVKRALTEAMPIQEIPYTYKRPRQSSMKALMAPPRPSTSGINFQTQTKHKERDNVALVTAGDTEKSPFRWVRTIPTEDEDNDPSTEVSDRKA